MCDSHAVATVLGATRRGRSQRTSEAGLVSEAVDLTVAYFRSSRTQAQGTCQPTYTDTSLGRCDTTRHGGCTRMAQNTGLHTLATVFGVVRSFESPPGHPASHSQPIGTEPAALESLRLRYFKVRRCELHADAHLKESLRAAPTRSTTFYWRRLEASIFAFRILKQTQFCGDPRR